MTNKNDKLSSDGELSQYPEKPKRGDSLWGRRLSLPIIGGIAAVVAVLGFVVGLIVFPLLPPNPNVMIDSVPRTNTPLPIGDAQFLPSPTPIASCADLPPTGARIAYVDYNAVNYRLFITDPERLTRCALTDLPNNLTQLDVSPDGSRIAYTRDENGTSDLWVADINGGNPVNATESISAAVRAPSWSPNGLRIAFAGEEDGASSIYVLDAEAGTISAVSSGSQPVWSPDGTRIAFANADGFLSVMDDDGTDARRVTNSDQAEGLPSWSADGTRIMFGRKGGGDQYVQVYTVNPDDPQMEHQFIGNFPVGVTALQWLPNGRYAYIGYGNLGLHSRLLPVEGGGTDDKIVIVNVNTFDWWTPPS